MPLTMKLLYLDETNCKVLACSLIKLGIWFCVGRMPGTGEHGGQRTIACYEGVYEKMMAQASLDGILIFGESTYER